MARSPKQHGNRREPPKNITSLKHNVVGFGKPEVYRPWEVTVFIVFLLKALLRFEIFI